MPSKRDIYYKGLDLYGQGNLEEAIEEFNKALEIDANDGEIYLAISMAYQRLQDLDKALDAAQHSVELSSNDPLAYTNLSRVCQKKGLFPEAEEALAMSRRISSEY
ncbi:MAG: tetratricopeptide repeat protein [Candidatus Omnitrophota bacterium]